MIKHSDSSDLRFLSLFLNIRSIPRNFEEFMIDFTPEIISYDIICFCETRLVSSLETLYHIPGYTLFSNPRSTRGGGVAIYSKNDHCGEIIQSLSCMLSCIETIFIECCFQGEKFLIGCIYRPPSFSVRDFLSEFTRILAVIRDNFGNHKVSINGDFNINLIEETQSGGALKYLSLFFTGGLFPVILRPTRIGSSTASLLDHMWTSFIDRVSNTGIIMSNISDHFPVFSIVSSPGSDLARNHCKIIKYRSDSEDNRIAFSSDVLSHDWTFVEEFDSADSAYNAFSDRITSLYDKNFPVRTRKVKRIDELKPYITKEIKLLIKKKHKLQKSYNKWPISYAKEYKAMRNKLNSLIKTARAKYYRGKLASGGQSPQNTWRIVNSILGRERKQCSYKILVDGVLVSDPYDVATGFNRYFSEVGANLASKFNDTDDFLEYLSENSCIQNFQMSPTTVEEVASVILALRDASPGHDGLPLFIFRENINILVNPVTYICNLSLSKGVFPSNLAIAKVVCIFKSGDPKKPENYRPISVLPIFSKVLEKLVYVRLTAHFVDSNLLTPYQFGFRDGVSTLDAIHAIVDSLHSSFNVDKIVIGVFIDLAKAFDSLDRRKLLLKLSHYGVSGVALDWFRSYFSKRQQFVNYNGVSSSTFSINYGVAQGSLVGPLLFIIFMNDIVNCSKLLNFILYADDTNVFLDVDDLSRGLTVVNSELQKLSAWMKCNSLTLNETKLHYVVFSGKRRILHTSRDVLRMDGNVIKKVTSTKFLGIQLDERLLFDVHISFIIRKVSKFIPILYNIRSILTPIALKYIYHGLIYPNLTYCVSVWGNCPKSYLNPLFILQKKIIRIICFKNRIAHSAPLFKSLFFLPLDMIIIYMTCTYTFKVLQRRSGQYFEVFGCPYGTRRSDAPTLSLDGWAQRSGTLFRSKLETCIFRMTSSKA